MYSNHFNCIGSIVRQLSLTALIFSAACGSSNTQQAQPAIVSPSVTDAGPITDASAVISDEDPYLWLEEPSSAEALAWVKKQNAVSTGELTAATGFEPLKQRLRGILDNKDKIPWITKRGKYYYNFWRDEKQTRGVWRRVTSLGEYRKSRPRWETVLDLDALADREKQPWVWHGATCLYPRHERCLLRLSRGGADAVEVREFDTKAKEFVEGGFFLPEAKTLVSWKDRDTLYVGTDFGDGTLTDSGYPRLAKEWRRGTPLESAKLVYEGKKTDMNVIASRTWDHGHARDFVKRSISFYENEYFLLRNGQLVPLPVPLSAKAGTWDDQIWIWLRDPWQQDGKTWPKDSLLIGHFDDVLAGKPKFEALFVPAPNRSLASVTLLRSGIITTELEDVRSKANVWTLRKGRWRQTPLDAKGVGSFYLGAVEKYDSDEFWFMATDFTLPSTLSIVGLEGRFKQLKQSPAFFDTKDLVVEQHFAVSKDGEKIPYFQVARRDLKLNGANPTLLTGYGGFEISMQPNYSPLAGAAWLERGGVFAQANIRGGGEYGPAWHQAAVKAGRQKAYDDFIAVAEDLIKRGVTSPVRLGIQGGSNGGLLVGVMLTQRPDLFGAVVCRVPLLDMKRYHKLLAGASWMAEYGNPDVKEEWEFIARYSPYHNVSSATQYPRVLFTTSTRDDRVHPGHARKMAARMMKQGHDILYYENIEGGHGGAANNEQQAFMSALSYTFLANQLGL